MRDIFRRKASLADVAVVVRGLMSPRVDVGSDLSDVDPATMTPFLTSSVESGGSSGPVGELLLAKYSHDPRHLIDLVQRRIPSPDRVTGEWAREYLKADRTSPPVLSMTPVELSLIVHSPDPSSLPLRTVRRGRMKLTAVGRVDVEGPSLWEQ